MQTAEEVARKAILDATAEFGKASGLEAAAKIMLEMANHNGRVVGTNELRDTAKQIQQIAAEIRASAEGVVGIKSNS